MRTYTVVYTVTYKTEVHAENMDQAHDLAEQFRKMNGNRTIIDVIPPRP